MSDVATLNPDKLTAKAHTYDNLHNEGGEGYNPYWAEIERREMAEEAARPRDKSNVLDDIERVKASLSPTSSDGWGPGSAVSELRARLEKLETELAEIDASDEARFLAVWTPETTIARRAEWNNWIKSTKPTPGDWKAIHDKERDLGWQTHDLKRAMNMHNL